MIKTNRRSLFKGVAGGAVSVSFCSSLPSFAATATPRVEKSCTPDALATPTWAEGIEGQRKADLGNGFYRNPIIGGDHPDPTILKDGKDYYMTFSSFNSYPGIVIWHSRDLVNWTPIGPALKQNIGTVWALDLCKVGDRYYVYIPAAKDGEPWSIYVIWTDDIRGQWSDPIKLDVEGCIDPGHVVGEDGKRYLFVNGIRKIRLTDDGLAIEGKLESAYNPWRYPEDWIVENFAPEGPKLMRRGDWFYLVTAVGGTAGPVTGHMVIAARSKSIHGPWEHCPNNPLVRTTSTDEPWWSRGHATLIEGPRGDWWMVYHGYENGYRTLGRQTLLEPIEWTDDGWFVAKGGDLSLPLPLPLVQKNAQNGHALSDNFKSNKYGLQWSFDNPRDNELDRLNIAKGSLTLAASGTSPRDSSPLVCIAPDRSYQAEVNIELTDNSEAGIMVFYNNKAFVGVGFTRDFVKNYQYAEEQVWARVPFVGHKLRVRMSNIEHVLSFEYSHDHGKTWQRHPTRMEVSGLHHNVFGGFVSLRIGLFCCGQDKAVFKDFRYQAIA